MSTLIERIAENWLINASERGYETAFTQSLIVQGYTIVDISTHGQLEQGKDIISIDPKGNACCFQLKDEKITLSEWRKIKSEIDELIEIPIKHPNFTEFKNHRSVLVTNKDMTAPARNTISDYNKVWMRRGIPPLEVITKNQLLKIFVDSHGEYLPIEMEDFQLFLELLIIKGESGVDKEKFSAFLESYVLSIQNDDLPINRMLSSLVILCHYILGNVDSKNNHVNIIESWMLFLNYLMYLVEKYSLKEDIWKKTYDIIFEKITFQLSLLKKEVLEGAPLLLSGWDGGVLFQIRLGILAGWLSAYELATKSLDDDYVLDEKVYQFIVDNLNQMTYWGESATPFFILMSKFSEAFNEDFSNKLIYDTLNELVLNNNKEDCIGVPDPYWSPEKVLDLEFDILDEPFNRKDFINHAYHLTSLVNILVKKDKKATLQAIWPELTFILNTKIVPIKIEDYYLYRIIEADVESNFYDMPKF